jgi:hypothetical protein
VRASVLRRTAGDSTTAVRTAIANAFRRVGGFRTGLLSANGDVEITKALRIMPTVVREAGFEVRIYTLDHPPPHVHV